MGFQDKQYLGYKTNEFALIFVRRLSNYLKCAMKDYVSAVCTNQFYRVGGFFEWLIAAQLALLACFRIAQH